MQNTNTQHVENMNEVFANVSKDLEKAIAQWNYHNDIMELHWKHFGEVPTEMVNENSQLYVRANNLDFRVKTLARIAHLFQAVADDGRFAQSFPEVENVDDMIRHFMR